MKIKVLRVCYFGTYESDYPRNRLFINGLKANGVQVFECHIPFWERVNTKDSGFGFNIREISRFLIVQVQLLWKYLTKIPKHDIIMVGYIGQMDMFLAKILASLTNRILVFNPNISIYDTAISDRQYSSPDSFKASFLKWLDKKTAKMADLVFIDTDAHRKYFHNIFGVDLEKIKRIWVGADETMFSPTKMKNGERKDRFEVLFVGKFIPLHGLPKIVEAAKILSSQTNIHFRLIGDGQLYQQIKTKIETLNLTNIEMIGWIPKHELSNLLGEADVVLGIFGDSDKAYRVIPNKVYEAMASGKTIITMDSAASRELFLHKREVYLTQNTPDAIAQAIEELSKNPNLCIEIKNNAKRMFDEKLNTYAIGSEVKLELEELILYQRQKTKLFKDV